MTEGGRTRLEPGAKRIRGFARGVAVLDTVRPLYVWEHPGYPAYYVPRGDVRTDLLVATNTVTHSARRGDAAHFTLKVDGEERVDAAWEYTESPVVEIRDHLRFAWNAMDAWFEEDEEVYVHPRSPYTRIDILRSSRRARVAIGGVVIAESARASVLHETGLPPRWYFPPTDVRMDFLEPTDHVTQCPYKGQAEYWSVRTGERFEENVAWCYRTPLRESERIAGLIAFYDDRVDLTVDDN
jgi:uncharacterized protein (DUF427 family)